MTRRPPDRSAKRPARSGERIVPLLVGLAEVTLWVCQWHTEDDLHGWRPAARSRRGQVRGVFLHPSPLEWPVWLIDLSRRSWYVGV